MTCTLEVTTLILPSEVGVTLLSLNELGEKSAATFILGSFVNKP